MQAADHTEGALPVKVESVSSTFLFWKALDKSAGREKMGDWGMELHVPFSNDLFSFPTSLARSGPSEVYFLRGLFTAEDAEAAEPSWVPCPHGTPGGHEARRGV